MAIVRTRHLLCIHRKKEESGKEVFMSYIIELEERLERQERLLAKLIKDDHDQIEIKFPE